MFFLSTPLKNYFFKLFIKEESEKDSDTKNWKSFRFTSYDNPKISHSLIDEVKKDMPEAAFAQEHLAQFVDDVLGVFRNVLASLISRELDEPEYKHSYVFGIDLAKKNDFSVITVIDVDTREVVKIERFNQIDYTFQVEKIVEMANRWKPSKIVVEENNVGAVVLELLERKGVKNIRAFSTNNTSKKEIIEALSLAFEQFQIYLYNYPQLLNELEVFETKMGKGGTYTYSAPSGSHDDCVMSLALAYSEIAPYREKELKPKTIQAFTMKI
jgi:phage FluMu gp28-like protein